jgi:predicted DCC family thiol-disulfide oxidoreductase YuxK
MHADRNRWISYAPIQGETALRYLPDHLRDATKLATVVYWVNDGSKCMLHLKSQAIYTVLMDIGGPCYWLGRLIKAVPPGVREHGYNFISKHRKKFFPRSACRLPTPAEREQMLP